MEKLGQSLAANLTDTNWQITPTTDRKFKYTLKLSSTSGDLLEKMRHMRTYFERIYEKGKHTLEKRKKGGPKQGSSPPNPYLIIRAYHNIEISMTYLNNIFAIMNIGVYFESTLDGFMIVFSEKRDFEMVLQAISAPFT